MKPEKNSSFKNINNISLLKMFSLSMLVILYITLFVSCLSISANAAKPKDGWYMSKKGRAYYYENGKKVKGQQKQIGKKTYYFDKKGRQHVGWIEYKGHYYYYKIGAKKKGYLICNKTINGIKLNSKGWAVNNKEKARLLAQANKIVFSITNFKMSQNQKNKACFLYIRNINWRNLTSFKSNLKNWDQYYASYAIFKGYGDCYTGGCGFAYLATAAGAKKVYAVSSGGHGWAEINGRYYDPNWSWISNSVDKCFNVPASLSGRGGRPSWSKHRSYVKRVD